MMPHAMPVRMCTLRMWVRHVEQMSQISQSSRTTMVESNMKSEHNLYLACERLSTTCSLLCTFSRSLVPSWLLLYTEFIAFSFIVPPTIGCVQHPTP